MLTRRRRNKFRGRLTNLHPHIILAKSDQFLRSLSVNHFISIIVIGFFLFFGFLAFYLPREPEHKTFRTAEHSFQDNAMDSKTNNVLVQNNIDPEGHVQIFYYPWYGNPKHDKHYIHWNHDILPHWESSVNAQYKIGAKYDPLQDEIGASYYPSLGAYSSSDPSVIRDHFSMLLHINISVIIVSWHSPIAIQNNPNHAFSEKDKITANNLDLLFKYAAVYDMKIAIHLEPYNGRTAESTYKDLQYIQEKYAHLPAFYRSTKHQNKPFYYVYDSYKMNNNEWRKLLVKGVDDKLCVRGSDFDGVFLGLYLNRNPSENHIIQSGFDGFYTYFAADGFTDGSSPTKQWKRIAKWAKQKHLIFVPSVGPGYNDLRVRPWNGENTKSRDKGEYYKTFWNEILGINEEEVKSDSDGIQYVSITSFNEWHEGTQIEPSIAKTSKNGYKYMDYAEEGGPDAYLKMTHELVNAFLKTV
eukprot:91756_1